MELINTDASKNQALTVADAELTASYDLLPPEMWEEVFKNLDHYDIASCSMVDRNFLIITSQHFCIQMSCAALTYSMVQEYLSQVPPHSDSLKMSLDCYKSNGEELRATPYVFELPLGSRANFFGRHQLNELLIQGKVDKAIECANQYKNDYTTYMTFLFDMVINGYLTEAQEIADEFCPAEDKGKKSGDYWQICQNIAIMQLENGDVDGALKTAKKPTHFKSQHYIKYLIVEYLLKNGRSDEAEKITFKPWSSTGDQAAWMIKEYQEVSPLLDIIHDRGFLMKDALSPERKVTAHAMEFFIESIVLAVNQKGKTFVDRARIYRVIAEDYFPHDKREEGYALILKAARTIIRKT